MVTYFLVSFIFTLYVHFHGPHLNFLDVSLMTTAGLFLILVIALLWSSRQ